MSAKINLHLLILCGILCQGIIATLSNDDTKESFNILARKRRVITHTARGLTPMQIEDVNYIVSIRENNTAACTGVILSHHTVITVARCVLLHESFYKISAGTTVYKSNSLYNVSSKIEHYGNPPHQQFDGIALLTVNPPFVYTRKINNIQLYERPLTVGAHVNVFGWGCKYPPKPAPPSAAGGRILHSISLPIISLRECDNIYQENYIRNRRLNIQNPFTVSIKHLCTYDPHQYCARTDAGAPLVYSDKLAGIHVWKGEFPSARNPDVFIDIQLPQYSVWIRENTR